MPGICDRLNLKTPEQLYQERRGQPLAKPVKGESKRAQQRLEREHDAARVKCRRTVVAQDSHRCRKCWRRVYLKPSEAPSLLLIAHVHEWIWRSWGGDDTDPTNCLTLCAECHGLFHPQLGLSAVLWQIVACDARLLMRGVVEFVPVIRARVQSSAPAENASR